MLQLLKMTNDICDLNLLQINTLANYEFQKRMWNEKHKKAVSVLLQGKFRLQFKVILKF